MKSFLFLSIILLSSFGSFSQSNHALNFDGTSIVDLGSSAGNNIRTIELWFYLNEKIDATLSDYSTLISREVNAANDDEFSLWFRPSSAPLPGTLVFRFADDINNQYRVFSDTTQWNAGVWYHVAAVIDPVQGMKMFIDGKLQTSTHPHNQAAAIRNEATVLGGLGNPAIRYFNGKIDDVRLSTAVEYTSNFTPTCPDLKRTSGTIGLWNFEEGSGLVAKDSSGLANDGMIIGAQYEKVCICGGNSLLFSGANSFVDLGPTVGNKVRTIELWFKPFEDINSSISDYQTLVAREVNAANEDEFSLWFRPTATPQAGSLVFRFADDVNNQYRVFSDTTQWNAGVWYHVAAVIDPVQGMRLFIDGKLQNSSHTNTKETATINANTKVGVLGPTNIREFHGQIDDLHFASSALYTTNFVPPCPNRSPEGTTLGLWYFNEGSGTTAIDAGTLGFDGTISSANYVCDSICDKVLSLNNLHELPNITIYPNPTKGRLYLDLGLLSLKHSISAVHIFSLEGKDFGLVSTRVNDAEMEINLNKKLANGVYILQIQLDNQLVAYQKILLHR